MKINEIDRHPASKSEKLLLKYFRIEGEFKINNDDSITINGNCFLKKLNQFTKLPIKFELITGIFNIADSHLTTLEGCPKEIGSSFRCHNNDLTSLIGGPETVGSHYQCITNNITSLDGLPKLVGGSFWISYNLHLPLLRLLSIKDIKHIDFDPVSDDTKIIGKILNKYIGNPSSGNILACAAELTRVGFKENARR